MMEHTQGTWRVTGTGTIRYIDVSVGNGMVQEVATCMHTEHGDMEANARRIVACVNACHGLCTDELERFGLASAFGTELLEIEKQRDALLVALEELFDVYSAPDGTEVDKRLAMIDARAAIQQVRSKG